MTSIPGHTRTEFAHDLLARLGFRVTRANTRALLAWMQAEGGSASYNPLNTTQPAAGASNYNSVGVKNYTSYNQGLTATAQTLRNGHYGPILRALRAGKSAMDVARAVAKTPWGTGSGVVRVLGGHVESGDTKVAGGGGAHASNAGLSDVVTGAAGPLAGFVGGLFGGAIGDKVKQIENFGLRAGMTALGVTAGLALVVLGIYHGVQKPDSGSSGSDGGSVSPIAPTPSPAPSGANKANKGPSAAAGKTGAASKAATVAEVAPVVAV